MSCNIQRGGFGGLKGHGDRTGGLKGSARSGKQGAQAAMADPGIRGDMADQGTPWAIAGWPPPQNIFLGRLYSGGTEEVRALGSTLEARTLGGALEGWNGRYEV